MGFKKATQFISWSWSAFSTWRQCAFKAKLKQIDKLKEPGNAAMDRGDTIHKEGQAFLIGALDEVPVSFILFSKKLFQLRKNKAVAEASWAWTKLWVRCAATDWANAWLRIKVDAHFFDKRTKTVTLVDFKSGKDHSQSDDNKEQMELYELGVMLMYPEAKTIVTLLWYVDHGTEAKKVVAVGPKTLEAAKKAWEKKVTPMMNDKYFPKQPSRLCDWCHFRKSNGGPCDQG